jgi:hypothetical protein
MVVVGCCCFLFFHPTSLFFCSPNGNNNNNPTKKQGVCHIVALPFKFKGILRQKEEELWKLKYLTMQKYNLQNNPLKETKNPSRYYYNSITNLKFQHKPKYHVSKILI